LVLYGVLLGDLAMSVVATFIGLAAVAWFGLTFQPLARTELLVLTNLALAVLVVGLAAFAIWWQHNRLLETLRRKGVELRRELQTRQRLNAVIFHDIRNPLLLLSTMLEREKEAHPNEILRWEPLTRSARRIAAIIQSVRDLDPAAQRELSLENIPVAQLWSDVRENCGHRLAQKEQRFAVTSDDTLQVRTNAGLLCHSVLSNLLINAHKFSPRGATITAMATLEGNRVRLQVRDAGNGFPSAMLQPITPELTVAPQPGTEGELGSGYGLQIAALYLRRLGGNLEIRNHPDGGGVAAVLLPRATE
jgi:signal transduction histidine kinase